MASPVAATRFSGTLTGSALALHRRAAQCTTTRCTPRLKVSAAASFSAQPAPAPVAPALQQQRQRQGRRCAPVCAKKKAAEVASGKVEEATAVATAAYNGLPIFWQARGRRA